MLSLAGTQRVCVRSEGLGERKKKEWTEIILFVSLTLIGKVNLLTQMIRIFMLPRVHKPQTVKIGGPIRHLQWHIQYQHLLEHLRFCTYILIAIDKNNIYSCKQLENINLI